MTITFSNVDDGRGTSRDLKKQQQLVLAFDRLKKTSDWFGHADNNAKSWFITPSISVMFVVQHARDVLSAKRHEILYKSSVMSFM